MISVTKDRILPVSNTLDIPNPLTERQLYRLSIFLTQSIMDIMCSPLNDQSKGNNEEKIKLQRALDIIFPQEWLRFALVSPHYYLDVTKLIKKYHHTFSEETINTIHRVVEFFCYEIIETTVLISPYEKISLVYPYDIIRGIEQDEILLNVLEEQKIYIVENISIKPTDISFNRVNMSRKGNQLIRIFVELLIKNTLKTDTLIKNSTNEQP